MAPGWRAAVGCQLPRHLGWPGTNTYLCNESRAAQPWHRGSPDQPCSMAQRNDPERHDRAGAVPRPARRQNRTDDRLAGPHARPRPHSGQYCNSHGPFAGLIVAGLKIVDKKHNIKASLPASPL